MLKQSTVLSKKYCKYYVCEHLKYCTHIKEYRLNKNVCLNIVLSTFFVNAHLLRGADVGYLVLQHLSA